MNAPIETLSHLIQNSHVVPLFLDALIKSIVVLTTAGAMCFLWRSASAATRHLIWFVAVAALPFLPFLSSLLPSWPRPLWSVSTGFDSGNRISLSFELAPDKEPAATIREAAALPAGTRAAGSDQPVSQRRTARLDANWLVVGAAAWFGGVTLLCLSIVTGQLSLRKISRRAQRVQQASWILLLRETCAGLRLRRRVTLLQSDENVMPMTWGWWRPVVLLPAGAAQWPAERRRVVLLHELAHVKRWDCLTQLIGRIVCAFFWFNPLVWLAARRMRVEQERACDDLVLNGGWRASEYATHLVEIARAFERTPRVAAIGMARSSQLSGRIAAIVDASRTRRVRPVTVLIVLAVVGVLVCCVGGWSAGSSGAETGSETSLGQQQLDLLKAFSAAKLKQSQLLAASSGETISPEFQRFFDAAIAGDLQTVTNMWASFHARHHQYERVKGIPFDPRLTTSFWGPVLEICLAYEHFANCNPKYTWIAVHDMINSIPRGSIYFGGTDPGRGLPTAFSKSHADADPFYTLTQNALADGTYLDYLRNTYGARRHWLVPLSEAGRADSALQTLIHEYQDSCESFAKLLSTYPADDPRCKAAEDTNEDLRKKVGKQLDEVLANLQARTDAGKKAALLAEPPPVIYTPTDEDSQKAFADYTADAGRRLEHDQKFPNEPRQIRPGEEITRDTNGAVQIRGQVAVMSINALLAKIVFDKNPDREFYVEESFPLDWMYPHLEPHGLIMKLDREPVARLSEDLVQKDHEYWQRLVDGMIGAWLTEDTPVQTVTAFAEKTYLRKDLSGFTGDPGYVRGDWAPKMFSKWRSTIAGLYAWRLGLAAGTPTPPEYLPKTPAERDRMTKAADFAFRQAFALCPNSPEAVYRYVNFLVGQKRTSDALLIAESASHLDPNNGQLKALTQQLKASQQSR